MKWAEWAPGVAQVRDYRRAWLRGDLLAGLTVAAYLVPQVMAYAALAGVPPVVGLWAAIVPLVAYALLGSSRQLSVGPESTTALMTAAVLAPMAAGDPARYGALAAVLALLVGAICVLGGVARVGFLANLLSRPVLVGYMTGIAIVMIASQLGKITGVPVSGDTFIDQVRSFASGFKQSHLPTIALAALVLTLLLVLAWLAPPAPGPLIAVLVGRRWWPAFSLHARGIDVVGQIPAGLPAPGVPRFSVDEMVALIIPAVGAPPANIPTAVRPRSTWHAERRARRRGSEAPPHVFVTALCCGVFQLRTVDDNWPCIATMQSCNHIRVGLASIGVVTGR